MVNRVALMIAVGFSILGAGCFPVQPPEKTEEAQPETTRPVSFTIPGVNQEQKEIDLASFKGQVVLLDFWATWCLPCHSELPGLNALYRELKGKGFVVIGMTVDLGKLEDVTGAVSRLGLAYPAGLAGGEVQDLYGGIRAIPTKFLLDRKGVVRNKYVGVVPERQLRADIEPLLAE